MQYEECISVPRCVSLDRSHMRIQEAIVETVQYELRAASGQRPHDFAIISMMAGRREYTLSHAALRPADRMWTIGGGAGGGSWPAVVVNTGWLAGQG